MRVGDVFELPVTAEEIADNDVFDDDQFEALAHAANNHDELVEALEMLETTCSDIHIFDHPIRVYVREVIKQAKGE